MDLISPEIFNSLCKICKEHGWYIPEENFRKVYKNIEESKTGGVDFANKIVCECHVNYRFFNPDGSYQVRMTTTGENYFTTIRLTKLFIAFPVIMHTIDFGELYHFQTDDFYLDFKDIKSEHDIENVLMQVEEHIKEVNDCIGTKGKMNKKLRNLQGDF
jgi:hypothetical protein